MTDKITINIASVKKFKGQALTPVIEKELRKLIIAREKINQAFEFIEDIIARDMEEKNVKLIEHDGLRITRTVQGRRFAFNPEEKVSSKFVKPVTYNNVDSEAVNEYFKKNNKLPSGIIEKVRTIAVKIEIKE